MQTMKQPTIAATLALAVAALHAAVPAAPANTGTLLKADSLRTEPYIDSKTVSSLAPGERVEILQRQAGWFRVKTAKGGGWVRMLSVRRGEPAKANAAGEVSGLLGLAAGRAGTGKVVATTGIRGLSEEQLKAASYSESELTFSDSLVASRTDAAKFAAAGKLAARAFDYLPVPTE
jgi:hypothetical protein